MRNVFRSLKNYYFALRFSLDGYSCLWIIVLHENFWWCCCLFLDYFGSETMSTKHSTRFYDEDSYKLLTTWPAFCSVTPDHVSLFFINKVAHMIYEFPIFSNIRSNCHQREILCGYPNSQKAQIIPHVTTARSLDSTEKSSGKGSCIFSGGGEYILSLDSATFWAT